MSRNEEAGEREEEGRRVLMGRLGDKKTEEGEGKAFSVLKISRRTRKNTSQYATGWQTLKRSQRLLWSS